MSTNEIIDILNAEGEKVGKMSREEAENDNHTTEHVLTFVFSSHGRVWVQLRPKTKKHYPGMWDISACGGVVSGESHEEAAKREAFEETGLEVDLHYVESFLNTFPDDSGETRKRLSYLYMAISDDKPVINDEIEEFKEWQVNELRQDVKSKPDKYVPSFLTELDKAVRGYELLVGQGRK